MRILILGHNGFIGQHLSRYLQSELPDTTVKGISFPEVDLSTQDGIQEIARFLTLDAVVIMCAAVKKQLGDSLDICRKNQQIAEKLCRLVQEYPIQQSVYFSSAFVYGEEFHT